MPPDTKKTIERITALLYTLPFDDYLSSENFFCYLREHDLFDAWKEYLEISQDRPELYGGAVKKNAFTLFFHHIFHSLPGDFLPLFTHFLSCFSKDSSPVLPLGDLKKDLMLLGYSAEEIESEFQKALSE